MSIKSKELLQELNRLERELDQFPSANDVIREGKYSINTYYNRFSWNWREIEDAYEKWVDSGTIDDENKLTDWMEFQRSL